MRGAKLNFGIYSTCIFFHELYLNLENKKLPDCGMNMYFFLKLQNYFKIWEGSLLISWGLENFTGSHEIKTKQNL